MGKKKKKQKNQYRDGAFLDTSFQLERIKFDEFEKNLDQLIGKYRVFSSYYSLYEFKTGVILSLIDYYFKVELSGDVSKELAKISDKWDRDIKYQLLLQVVLHRLNESIVTNDIKKYLRQVEAAIVYFLTVFNNKLSGLIGSFGGDEMVKLEITNRDSFQTFWDTYNDRDVLPMIEFWRTNRQPLTRLVAHTDLKTKYSEMHKRLEKIQEDPRNSEKLKRVNKGVGDAIIAIDCPKKHLLVTTDSSFDCLCPPLGKSHTKYSKL